MLVRTVKEWRDYLKLFDECDTLILDLETNGLEAWGSSHIVGVALKAGTHPAIYAPFRHAESNLPIERLQDLEPLLRTKRFLNHHSSFDLRFLMKMGLPLPTRLGDTMISCHLLDGNQSAALKTFATKYVDPQANADELALNALLMEHKLKSKADMWQLPPDKVAAYACQDVELVARLEEWLKPHLQNWKLDKLYEEKCAYLRILLKAEQRGFLLDRALVEEYAKEAGINKEALATEISELAGKEVNPASSKQMCELLNVRSSAEKVLRQLGEGDRRVLALLDFRGWNKLLGTYYRAFLDGMDGHNVLRAEFKINGTIAGRLSMASPNLQAVPQYSEMYKVKDVFIARPGYTLIEADYSALELRLAAHFTEEENLVEAFQKNESPHDTVAAKMGVDRHTAKTLNFSILYGAGPGRLAEAFGFDKTTAGALLASYWKANPRIYRWKESVQELARRNGYVRLWSGHIRRYLPEVPYSAGHKAKAQPHTSPNNVIQGSGAEIIRRATMRMDALGHPDCHLLLQVHDSLAYEVPDNYVDEFAKSLKSVMEFNPEFKVPLLVDLKVGKSWGKMEKYVENTTRMG